MSKRKHDGGNTPFPCGKIHDLCPICEQCPSHCTGHQGINPPQVPLNQINTPADLQVTCKSLLHWERDKDGNKVLRQCGRTDTHVLREVEEAGKKIGRKARRQTEVAA